MEKSNMEIVSEPFIEFTGKLEYYTSFFDCAMICDKILNEIQQSKNNVVFGFDMEWPYDSLRNFNGKTALIQLSPSLDECFLLQVSKLKKLPKSLTELLSHTSVQLVGVNINNDIYKLARDFPGIDSKCITDKCIDLRRIATSILKVSSYWSLEKLVNYCFKLQMNKDKSIRASKWDTIPLSPVQKQYAATDAYASPETIFLLKRKNVI